jgi:hypothetical protein
MITPSDTGYAYVVEGTVTFYLRRCTDSKYRIARWTDNTCLSTHPKPAGSSGIPVSHPVFSWGVFKKLF